VADSAARSFRRLGFEQRVAGVGALLLLVSTFGAFSFIEAAQLLVALAVLSLLRARADGKSFHLPFGDGALIAAAGAWAGLLILPRLFDRPLGQNLLALACAAILVFAGLREHVKRPRDDLIWPEPAEPPDDLMRRPADGERARPSDAPSEADETVTRRLPDRQASDAAITEPLPPPEFDPGPASSAGRRRGAPAHEDEAGRGGKELGGGRGD
jgi:hypothetical protein